MSRLTSITDSNLNGVFNTVAYTLNAVGNRTSKLSVFSSQPSVSENYSYDAIDQVTGVNSSTNTQTFAYDAVGNRQSVSTLWLLAQWITTSCCS
ncbi:MAG: hypothetical protein HC904_06075 [Blastochloris sp.]|nr:hypothetical protein [Blastochloris sp.]